MTKTEAIKILSDMRKTMKIENGDALSTEEITAVCIALDVLKSTVKLAPRWKTIKNNSEFWDIMQYWIDNNQGKNLDDFKDWLMEEVDIS